MVITGTTTDTTPPCSTSADRVVPADRGRYSPAGPAVRAEPVRVLDRASRRRRLLPPLLRRARSVEVAQPHWLQTLVSLGKSPTSTASDHDQSPAPRWGAGPRLSAVKNCPLLIRRATWIELRLTGISWRERRCGCCRAEA